MADISKISKINSAISKMNYADTAKKNPTNQSKLKDVTAIADKISKINKNKNNLKNTDFLSKQVKHVNELFNSMASVSRNFVNHSKQFASASLKNLRDISVNSLKSVGRISSELANQIKDSVGFNKQGFFTTLFMRINPMIGYALGKIINADSFKNLISTLKDKVVESFSKVYKKISGVFSKMWDGMKTRFKSVSTKVKSVFVKEPKEKKKPIRNITNNIKKKVPKLAQGGLIGKEGLAYVHGAEVVGSMAQIKKDIQSAVGLSVKKSWNPITTLFRQAKGEKNFYKDQPWQHILIRELKELRESITVREGKWTVAWKKMLDQHPLFSGLLKTIKALLNPIATLNKAFGIVKKTFGILSYPIRAPFKRKGVGYESDVKGKTQNQILGMIFSGEMSRLDKMVLLSTDIRNAIFDLTQYTTGKKMKGATAVNKDDRTIMKKALDFIISPITKNRKNELRSLEIKKLLREGGSHEDTSKALEELNDPKNNNLRKHFNKKSLNERSDILQYKIKQKFAGFKDRFFNKETSDTSKLSELHEQNRVKENIPLRNMNEISGDQLVEIKKLVELSAEIRDHSKCSCINEEKILKYVSNGQPITSTLMSPVTSLISKPGGKKFNKPTIVEDKRLGKIINIENARNAVKDKKQNKLFTYIGDAVDGVKGVVKKSGKGLMKYLIMALGSIGSIFGTAMGSVGGLIGSGMTSLVTGLGGLGSLLFSSLGGLGRLLSGSIGSVVKGLGSMVGGLGTSIAALGTSLFSKVKSLFSGANGSGFDDLDFDADGKAKKGKITNHKNITKKGSFWKHLFGKDTDIAGKASEAGFEAIAKASGKTGVKSVAKVGLKKLPILGPLVAMGLAGAALVDGRPITALAELASGLVSQVPGVGTAASFGIDAFIAGYDEKDKAAKAKEAEGEAGYNRSIEQKAINEYNERVGFQSFVQKKSPGKQQSTMGGSYRPNIKSYPTANVPTNNIAKQTTLAHEGIVQTPYKDAGGWSIGAGHYSNVLSALPEHLSKEEAKTLYDSDYDKHKNIAARLPEFGQLDSVRQGALIDMTYNMGSVSDWSNMRRNLATGNFEEAGRNVLQSKYASQVPERAKENANLIASGDPANFNYRDANVYTRQGGKIVDSVKYYHQGGFVYGEPGTEQKAVLKAGEYVVSEKDAEKAIKEKFTADSKLSGTRFRDSFNLNNPIQKAQSINAKDLNDEEKAVLAKFNNSTKTPTQLAVENIQSKVSDTAVSFKSNISEKVKIFNEQSKKLVEYTINESGQLFDKNNIISTYKIDKNGQLYSSITNDIIPLVKTKSGAIVAMSKDMSNKSSDYYKALSADIGPDVKKYADELKLTGKLKISEGVNFAKNIDTSKIKDQTIETAQKAASTGIDFAKSLPSKIESGIDNLNSQYNEYYAEKQNKNFDLSNKIKDFVSSSGLKIDSSANDLEKGLYISQQLIKNYEKGYKSDRLKQITDIKFKDGLRKYSDSSSVSKGLSIGYELFKHSLNSDSVDIPNESISYAKNYASSKDSSENIKKSELANMQISKDMIHQDNVSTQNEIMSDNTNAIKENTKLTNGNLSSMNSNLNNVSTSISNSNKTMISIQQSSANKNSDDSYGMDALANASGLT